MPRTTWSLLAGMLLSAGVACATPLAADNTTLPVDPQGFASRTLTLNDALTLAGTDNPELAAARAVVVASAADAEQSARFVNPELAIEVENFAGRDTQRGFDGAEMTLRLDQRFELGGQRGQRRALARAAYAVVVQQQNLIQAQIHLQTVEAFMTLLAAQQQQLLAEEQLQLTRRVGESIQAKIDTGKSPTIDAVRFQPLLIEARLERDRATGALTVARQALAAVLGLDSAAKIVAQGALDQLPEPPATQSVAAAPEMMLAAAAREQASAELAGAKLQSIPDLTLGVGVRRFEESGDTALVAGISLPLPLFDRNRSGVAAAAARLEQTRQLEQSRRLQSATAIARADAELRNTLTETRALQDELLPAAEQTFAAIDYGYQAGKYGLLELLDAQQQLTGLRSRLLATQVACHVAAARLNSLLGRTLPAGGAPFEHNDQ